MRSNVGRADVVSTAAVVDERHSGHRTVVLFLPDWRRGNPYQELLSDGLNTLGARVIFDQFEFVPFVFQSLRRSHPDVCVFHIHWIDNLIAPLFRDGFGIRGRVKRWMLALDILLLRLRGIRVVWTIHNLVAHESPNPDLELIIRRMIARAASALIIHSDSALRLVERNYGIPLGHKARVIPHGSYVGVYGSDEQRICQARKDLGVGDGVCVFLFFGSIRRYKGVAGLVWAFRRANRRNIQLIIAGDCKDNELKNELKSASEADIRIKLKIEFVPDEEVAALFALSDAVVLPFEDTLTSGSAVLAMSMGKALVLPAEARVLDLVDASGGVFYDELLELTDIFDRSETADLAAMGIANLGSVRQKAWKTIARETLEVYAGGSGVIRDARWH